MRNDGCAKPKVVSYGSSSSPCAHDAQLDAEAARTEALAETQAAAESAAEADDAKYHKLLAEQREARAKRKIEKLDRDPPSAARHVGGTCIRTL
eukprot:4617701-Prymnesium_polylepis.2